MTIENPNFESITQDDLEELIAGQVPEGLYLEYKRETYGNSDSNKREALKDVSAFANAHGGHLILGISENNGIPSSLNGLSGIDLDAEILRLDQIFRTSIEPRIIGIKIRAIQLDNGNAAILIRIPYSWNQPHRISYQSYNKFFVRNSGGVHEASIEELRNLFTLTTDALDKAKQFRVDRLNIIKEGHGARPLIDGGRLLLHIIPLSAFTSSNQVNLQAVHENHQLFRPIGSTGFSPRFNFDGFINERGGEHNHGYTQIFRNGIIEATFAGIVREREGNFNIPGLGIEEYIFHVLPSYINGLKNINISPPLIIMFTLEGVEGARYIISNDIFQHHGQVIDRPILFLPECILSDYGEDIDYHRTVKPAFDAIWNTAGYSESQFYNEDGLWIGQQQR